jgi:hypothetical protein
MAVCIASRTLGIKVAVQQSYQWTGSIATIQRRYEMKENVRDQLQICLRRAAAAAFSIGAVAAGAVHASPSNTGSFDFYSPLGNQAELVRFRQGQEDAVLDLPRVMAPKLMTMRRLTFLGPISDAGNHACTVTGPTIDAPPALDFGAIATVLSYELNRIFDVKQVRAQMTRSDAGTTFMLGEDGLYMIRRPAVEWIHQLMVIPPK